MDKKAKKEPRQETIQRDEPTVYALCHPAWVDRPCPVRTHYMVGQNGEVWINPGSS